MSFEENYFLWKSYFNIVLKSCFHQLPRGADTAWHDLKSGQGLKQEDKLLCSETNPSPAASTHCCPTTKLNKEKASLQKNPAVLTAITRTWVCSLWTWTRKRCSEKRSSFVVSLTASSLHHESGETNLFNMHSASSLLIQTLLYGHLNIQMTWRLFWLKNTPLVSPMWILLQNSVVTLGKKKDNSKDKREQRLEKRLLIPSLPPPSFFSPPVLRGTITKGACCLSESIQLGWSAATGTGIACSGSYHSGNLSPEHQITHCKCCKVMVTTGSWEDHSDLLWLVAHILSLSSWLTTASHCWISRLPVPNRPGDLVPPQQDQWSWAESWRSQTHPRKHPCYATNTIYLGWSNSKLFTTVAVHRGKPKNANKPPFQINNI